MAKSPNFIEYDKDFIQDNFISCEKEICKRLDWNFHQSTPYHFLENLLQQGIYLKGDLVNEKSVFTNPKNSLAPSPREFVKAGKNNNRKHTRSNRAYSYNRSEAFSRNYGKL